MKKIITFFLIIDLAVMVIFLLTNDFKNAFAGRSLEVESEEIEAEKTEVVKDSSSDDDLCQVEGSKVLVDCDSVDSTAMATTSNSASAYRPSTSVEEGFAKQGLCQVDGSRIYVSCRAAGQPAGTIIPEKIAPASVGTVEQGFRSMGLCPTTPNSRIYSSCD